MRWASSMAMSGVGGAPDLKSLEATYPAMPPRMNSRTATRKKPQKICELLTGSAHQASHAKPSSRIDRPKMAKTPAAAPIAAPLAILETFSVISVLASSISSRTRTWARSATSCTASEISFGVPVVVGSAAKASQDHGGQDAAGERDADLHLGALLHPDGARRGGRRLLEGRRLVGLRASVGGRVDLVGGHHSGGSSPNARRQIAAATRVVAIEATAPSPARRPDQISRLVTSLFMSRGVLSRRRTRPRGRHRSWPR